MTQQRRIMIRIWLCLGVLSLFVLVNLFAPNLAPYDPTKISMADKLQGFSWAHPFGTDNLGRDILSRVMYGGRSSIFIAATTTTLSMFLGMMIGVIAGYFGGVVDWFITVISNIFQGLPGMTLMIAIVGILKPSDFSLMLALVITSWVGFSRFVRGEVMRTKAETYIEGMHCLGAGHLRIIIRGILPNIFSNAVVLFTGRVGQTILSVASLSYLGLGIAPPTPDWGVMICDAQTYFRSAPHLLVAPGLCILIFALTLNLLGDQLRDYFDVKNGEVAEW